MQVPEFNANGAAHELGSEGVENLVAHAEQFCTQEQERIALSNEAPIIRLQAQNEVLLDTERTLHARLQSAPPPGSRARLRRRAIYYWLLTALLTMAGFMFVLLTFEPFHLGRKAWVYSAGIAVVTPFLMEHFLERPKMEKVMLWLTGIAAIAGLASLMIFAVIRGMLFAEQLRASEASSVVIDGGSETPAATPSTFYEETAWLLRLGMVLLAFSMETAAGLALHKAWQCAPDNSEDWGQLRKELAGIRHQRAELAHQLILLRNEPRMFAAQFWRDFTRTMVAKAKHNSQIKLPVVLFAVIVLGCASAHATTHSNTVIAVDLSASVGTPGPDGKTDFQKNVDGVTQALSRLGAGSSVTVVGITDHSYSQPFILLYARIPEDAGYFGERLTNSRAQLVRAWTLRSAHLAHSFRRTDILGALQLAADLFAQEPGAARKTLVIFSDMRQSTPDVNLERVPLVPVYTGLDKPYGPVPRLQNVEGYVLGVDGVGKSGEYWRSLRQFWTYFLQAAGVRVVTYSVLRDLPDDAPQISTTQSATGSRLPKSGVK